MGSSFEVFLSGVWWVGVQVVSCMFSGSLQMNLLTPLTQSVLKVSSSVNSLLC